MFIDILTQAYNVIARPKEAMKKTMSFNVASIYVGVLSLIPAIVYFITHSIVKISIGGKEITTFVITGRNIFTSFLWIILIMVTFFAVSALTRMFAKKMAERSGYEECGSVIAFGLTPFLISPLFGLIPYFNKVAAVFFIVYGIIILILGMKNIVRPHPMFALWMYLFPILFLMIFLLGTQFGINLS